MTEQKWNDEDRKQLESIKHKIYYIGYRIAKNGQESMDLDTIAGYVLSLLKEERGIL